jgi:hypothetical protein
MKVVTAIAVYNHIGGKRDTVENPREPSDLEGLYAFTIIGAEVTRRNTQHLCDMHTTKRKLSLEKAMMSQATHLIKVSRHCPMPNGTVSSRN